MVQYILDRYGKGRLHPSLAHLEHGTYLQWSWLRKPISLGHWAIVNHGREFPGTERIDAVVEEMQNRAQVCAQAVGAAVVNRTFILGEQFTAADAIMLGY